MADLAKARCSYCCNWSHQLEMPMKKCGACAKVYYCSAICQKADWKKHKLLCKPRSLTKNSTPLEELIQAFQISSMSDEQAVMACVAVINYAELSVANRNTLAKARASIHVLHLLGIKNNRIVKVCSYALAILAGNDDVIQQLMDNGVSILLVNAMNFFLNDEEIIIHGSTLMARLAADNTMNGRILGDAGACSLVMKLMELHASHSEVVTRVCIAVRDLAHHDTNRVKFAEVHGNELVAAYLNNPIAIRNQLYAVAGWGAVANLTRDNEFNARKLEEKGICESIIASVSLNIPEANTATSFLSALRCLMLGSRSTISTFNTERVWSLLQVIATDPKYTLGSQNMAGIVLGLMQIVKSEPRTMDLHLIEAHDIWYEKQLLEVIKRVNSVMNDKLRVKNVVTHSDKPSVAVSELMMNVLFGMLKMLNIFPSSFYQDESMVTFLRNIATDLARWMFIESPSAYAEAFGEILEVQSSQL